MSSSCITEIELCVPQHSSDGFAFYITENDTKEKLADHYDTIVFMAKRSARDSDDKTLFEPKVYEITDPDQTDLDVFFTPEDLDLKAGKYRYEIKGFRPGESIAQPIAVGDFVVAETVIDSTDGEVNES